MMETLRFIEILKNCHVEVRSYSGRRMYGAECVGFTTEYDDMFSDILDTASAAGATEAEVFEIAKLFVAAPTDSMGLSTIVYFPSMEWEEPAQ